MASIPAVPPVIPPESGYDPVANQFPLDQGITVIDQVGYAAANRQHLTGNKRDLTIQTTINAIIATLNAIVSGASDGGSLFVLRDGTNAMLAPLPMGGFRITGLANAATSTDAVNSATMSGAVSTCLDLACTRPLVGNLNANGNRIISVANPTSPGDAVNSQTYAGGVLSCLDLAGTRTMTGPLNMGGNYISNLASGVNVTDGAAIANLAGRVILDQILADTAVANPLSSRFSTNQYASQITVTMSGTAQSYTSFLNAAVRINSSTANETPGQVLAGNAISFVITTPTSSLTGVTINTLCLNLDPTRYSPPYATSFASPAVGGGAYTNNFLGWAQDQYGISLYVTRPTLTQLVFTFYVTTTITYPSTTLVECTQPLYTINVAGIQQGISRN